MMRKELQEQLVSDFPNLFINDRFDGFWVDDSWYDLIYKLSSDINKLILILPKEMHSIDYYVIQLKEKFGSLRYYMNKATPVMNEIITIAEMKSAYICYGCSGKIENKHFWNVRHCEKCSVIKKMLE